MIKQEVKTAPMLIETAAEPAAIKAVRRPKLQSASTAETPAAS